MKWSKNAGEFKVKVSYRKGKTATIAVPAPILQIWGYPAYLQFFADNGTVIIEPISEVTT